MVFPFCILQFYKDNLMNIVLFLEENLEYIKEEVKN